MKGRDFTISLLIALVYWIPSSIALHDIFMGPIMTYPVWLDTILMPGYILGLAFGYGGGSFWATIGQLISLVILFFIARIIYEPFRRKIFKDENE